MEFIKEGKREGHGYEVDKIHTLKDMDDALKKQAEDIIDLALGFECCPYCGNYKDIQNHHCSKCKKRIVMPDDAYWFSFYLKQQGGKGIKPKEKMRTVDYDHILQIAKRCADANKTARELYNLIIFAFGK